jgi:uncharacterized protein (UPF0333 family)
MLFRKNKGQGALEYLLLIGGAVLIAVIVIALLVGMGGQSRDTAQDQATKAQQSLDQPQPATIVSLDYESCNTGSDANVLVEWQKMGQGGTYTFRFYTFGEEMLGVGSETSHETEVELTDPSQYVIVNMSDENVCENTYWGEIATTKNGQTVTSTRMKINMKDTI